MEKAQDRVLSRLDTNSTHLARFGFSFTRASAHSSRTMMLAELSTLLSYVNRPDAARSDYLQAIQLDNCLGKRSQRTRSITAKHLTELYALDPTATTFRALRYFWPRDGQSHPLLALLCAFVRDPLLRLSAPMILPLPEGTPVQREAIEAQIDNAEPGRFSKATLRSTAQNLGSSWTQSGHLAGRAHKVRVQAEPTPGAVAYALFLGYLSGARGQSLFDSSYVKLLDCPGDQALALAETASRGGWLVLKHIGDVVEVLFPKLLTPQELAWIHEQN